MEKKKREREHCHRDLLLRLLPSFIGKKLNLKLAQIRNHFEPIEWLLFIQFSYTVTEVDIITNEHCYNRRT